MKTGATTSRPLECAKAISALFSMEASQSPEQFRKEVELRLLCLLD